MCISHFIRYASWSRDVEDKSWFNLKVMLGYEPKDGWSDRVLKWEMLAKQVSSNNTDLVFYPRQAPVHLPPHCYFKSLSPYMMH
jgi:hypothetical protein